MKLRKGWLIAPLAVAVAAGVGGMAHPFGDLRSTQESNAPLLSGSEVPQDVAGVLTAKCADCHSQRTVWPAYSHIAPGSWLMERDVRQGRKHLNLSHWQQYSFDDKQDLLQKIASESRSGEMPPGQYTWMHRDAKLSSAEQQRIYEWAKGERKRLKVAGTEVP